MASDVFGGFTHYRFSYCVYNVHVMLGLFHLRSLRDATQSPGKSPIFSPLKIGGRGVNPDFGKIETEDRRGREGGMGTLCCIPKGAAWK